MQVTAHPTGTPTEAPTSQETRPVRLLVPTRRRSDYWLSPEDTLRASDLGITRDTTDDELTTKIRDARKMLVRASTDDAANYLRRIRNALCHPRDIAEARAWGYDVPITTHENHQELDPEPTKRLGWWWVYSPDHVETREDREARYLADHRLIDAKGGGRVWCRSYVTVKDFKFDSERNRRILGEPDFRRELALGVAEEVPDLTPEQVQQYAKQVEESLVKHARRGILKALPAPRDRAGQSDLWWIADMIKSGRDLERLDEWYEYNKVKQTGRPKGSKTRPKAATS